MENNNRGLTLIELMVAMAVASIVMAGIFSAYQSQQKSALSQQLIVEMQQNSRAAMSLMKREIRMAGYNPTAHDGLDNDGDLNFDEADESSGAGIVAASHYFIQFSMDIGGGATDGLDNDGDTLIDEGDESYNGDTLDANENIIYGLADVDDADSDGIADAGAAPLRRNTDGLVPVTGDDDFIMANDICAIAVAYAFDDDLNGELDTSANGHVIWAYDDDPYNVDETLDRLLDTNDDGVIDVNDTPGGAALNPKVAFDRIRAVRIWILARTRAPIRGYTDSETYVVGDLRVPSGDSYQRRLLVDTVNCRNMGL